MAKMQYKTQWRWGALFLDKAINSACGYFEGLDSVHKRGSEKLFLLLSVRKRKIV